MAIASYATDLTTIIDYDGINGASTEPTVGWVAGRSPENADTDFPIQGTTHASLTMNTTGKAGLLTTGSTFTWQSGHYLFGWLIWLAPSTIEDTALGGLSMLCGDGEGTYKVFYVGGADFGSYPYGGWQNFAVDPELTHDEIFGSPSGYNVIGAGANVHTKVSKGNPLGNDAFRYGRGEFRISGGDLGNGYATFIDMATANDATSARWGLFQKIDGGYRFKGLMYFGFGSLTEFTDSDRSIVIDHHIYVNSDFNRIEFHNVGSIINWNNINFSSLSSVSRGQLEMIDNCTLNDDGGVFTGMDTFIYQSNATMTGRTWRGCNQITQGGATFDDCFIEASTATIAMVVDDLSLVNGCNFSSGGTGHGLDIGSFNADAIVSWGNTDEGYASSDGSTGNETILVNVASGFTLTINVINGGSTPTIKNDGLGSVVIQNAVPINVTVTDAVTGLPIQFARVMLQRDDTKAEIVSGETNASGVYATSINYTTDIDFVGWARESNLVGTDYNTGNFSGTITTNGANVSIALAPMDI